jgi:hypothetical protein
MLFAVSAGVLIFPTIAITAVPIFFASLCLWLLTRALKRGELWAAIAFGLTFAVYFFFSFASYMLALVMGIFLLAALITKVVSMSRAASVLLISIGTFIVFFAVLKLIWGFNIIDCYSMAQQMHLQRPGHGFDHPLRYLFRSTGGIIAYLISTSLAIPLLAIAAIARRHDEDRLRRAFTIGTLLGLLLSGFSGMSFLETERIWLIFTPALAVIAAAEMERRQHLEGHPLAAAVVLAALTFSCGYEIISRHHTWKPDAWLEKHQMELESNSGSTAPPDAAPAARLSEATRSKFARGTPC